MSEDTRAGGRTPGGRDGIPDSHGSWDDDRCFPPVAWDQTGGEGLGQSFSEVIWGSPLDLDVTSMCSIGTKDVCCAELVRQSCRMMARFFGLAVSVPREAASLHFSFLHPLIAGDTGVRVHRRGRTGGMDLPSSPRDPGVRRRSTQGSPHNNHCVSVSGRDGCRTSG